MSGRRNGSEQARGSILLPVIVVLLLIASAATAMTLQMRTSLREAAVRRDRLKLGYIADAAVRAAALAIGGAAANRTAPPFALDGTPQACRLPDGARLVLAVQDAGGLVDLNKGNGDLLRLVLQRAGLSGWDAKAMTDSILGRRDSGGSSERPTTRQRTVEQPHRPIASVDEIDRLPGMTPAVFDKLEPALTVHSGSTGIDPAVASTGVKMLVSMKELTGPSLSAAISPSTHDTYDVTGLIVSAQGMHVERRASIRREATGISVQQWDAPISFGVPTEASSGAFCSRIAAALEQR